MATPRFCTECGTRLNPDALFCHECGTPIEGGARRHADVSRGGGGAPPAAGVSRAGASPWLRWAVPAVAVFALLALTVARFGSRGSGADRADPAGSGAVPLGGRMMQAPDISSMSPQEQADRLFNRVMRLSSEGKADSAAFFASMAIGAIEALQPLDAHARYDLGLVALVTGDAAIARAQADTILAQRPTHLLGLALAARAADARGDASAGAAYRRRLLAEEPPERQRGLREYADHDADIRAAVELARTR